MVAAARTLAALIAAAVCAGCAGTTDSPATDHHPAPRPSAAAPAPTGHQLRCPEHEATVCGSRCVDTGTDAAHCGRCGLACSAVCRRGRCAAVTELSLGGGHGCARFDDARVRCWGSDQRGQIGDGQPNVAHIVPLEVGDLGEVARVAAGGQSSCAIVAGGKVQCWGDIVQRGGGLGTPSPARPLPLSISDAVQVSVGTASACAVTSAGRLLCWGENDVGQLGDGTRTRRRDPRPVRGLSDAVEVAVGPAHTCARSRDGAVHCWGSNPEGQLGDGMRIDRLLPTRVARLPPAKQLAAGQRHSCALLEDGTVRCWGSNLVGQLGDGSRDDRAGTGPVVVTQLSGVRAISSGGGEVTCALSNDGSVSCWGLFRPFGSTGRQGMSAPERVPDLDDVVEVAVGTAALCARKTNGTVWCWGQDIDSRGRPIERPKPTPLQW